MRLLRYVILMSCTLALACLVGFVALCMRIDSYGRIDRAQPTDAIVVLGAKVLPGGQPGPDLKSRTEHAVGLYQAGMAPRLICAGGAAGDPMSAASVCRSVASALQVPAEVIFLADGPSNTEQEAGQVASVMGEHGWRSAVLVSHPLHVYRAKLFFERQGLTVYTSPTTTNVDGIDLPFRTYYAIREAAGILWPYLHQMGFRSEWTLALQEWVYSAAP